MSRTRGEVAGSAIMGPRRKLVFPLGVALRCTEPSSLCAFVTVYSLLFCREGRGKAQGTKKTTTLLSSLWCETETTQGPLS